ncbi:hypothetical protein GX51_04880 [Blastomyces parvus]|uniref:Uncharacterized protein n=1 Tax=Blastomyces parvus TaxID=2060905 RepID=A0A2B7X068_9EURO|nr:hypothetical protein GX51_04880 [Blastomyces parvus]
MAVVSSETFALNVGRGAWPSGNIAYFASLPMPTKKELFSVICSLINSPPGGEKARKIFETTWPSMVPLCGSEQVELLSELLKSLTALRDSTGNSPDERFRNKQNVTEELKTGSRIRLPSYDALTHTPYRSFYPGRTLQSYEGCGRTKDPIWTARYI